MFMGNSKIKRIIMLGTLVVLVLLVSCQTCDSGRKKSMPICFINEKPIYDFAEVGLRDIVMSIFINPQTRERIDNAQKLQELLTKGLPVNNFYGQNGNFEKIDRKSPSCCCDKTLSPLLWVALKYNATNSVEVLLNYGAKIDARDFTGNTAFMMLSRCRGQYMQDLYEKWKDYFAVDGKNRYGQTALYFAIVNNNPYMVQKLLRSGANGSVVCRKSPHPTNMAFPTEAPLIFMVASGSYEVFQAFVSNWTISLDANKNDYYGNSIFDSISPCLEFYEERIDYLVKRGYYLRDFSNEYQSNNILIKNLIYMGDNPERIKFLLGCGIEKSQVEATLNFIEHESELKEKGCQQHNNVDYVNTRKILDKYLNIE